MVQNWENFMDPRGGYYNTDFISGTSSIIGSLAIDLLARPAMDYAEKPTIKASKRNILGQGSQRLKDMTSAARASYMGVNTAADMEKIRATGREYTAASKKATTKIKKQFKTSRNLLRGLSWTLFATFIADTAESVFLPGVTGAARKSDQMAMGMGGPLDSEGAYTQRQRALMAIHDSQLGIRSVIGNEAGHFHR